MHILELFRRMLERSMTNRWMTWLANLATHCAVVAMALWGGTPLAQGNAPGGGADFSGSLQEGSASLADHWVEPGSASTRVTQSQFVDDIDYYVVLARWKLAIVLEQGFQRAGDNEKLQAFGPIVLDLMAGAADLAETTDYAVT